MEMGRYPSCVHVPFLLCLSLLFFQFLLGVALTTPVSDLYLIRPGSSLPADSPQP